MTTALDHASSLVARDEPQSFDDRQRARFATPDPGVHPGTPMDVYHRWHAASNSRLSRLRRSPAHLKAYLEAEAEDTIALRVGRACHTAILEPHLFASTFTVAEQCAATKKDGGRCANAGTAFHEELGWLCGVHAKGAPAGFDYSRIVLPQGEYETMALVAASVRAHPSASALLEGDGHAELSALWFDKESETLCKARFDRLSPLIAGGTIVDIKTTRDASPREFERSIFTLGYHRQGAFYLDGARALGLQAEHFVIIAVEKEPPYAVAVYRLTEGALDAGRAQLRVLLDTYAECVRTDSWPAYDEDVRDISLPDWAWKQIDDDIRGNE